MRFAAYVFYIPDKCYLSHTSVYTFIWLSSLVTMTDRSRWFCVWRATARAVDNDLSAHTAQVVGILDPRCTCWPKRWTLISYLNGYFHRAEFWKFTESLSLWFFLKLLFLAYRFDVIYVSSSWFWVLMTFFLWLLLDVLIFGSLFWNCRFTWGYQNYHVDPYISLWQIFVGMIYNCKVILKPQNWVGTVLLTMQ